MPSIIADIREKNSLVIAELTSKNIDVELKHLKVADYIIGNIAVERKTTQDFISSMLNKRLLKQLEALKQYKKRILLIEGIDEQELYNDSNNKTEKGVHANAIRGMLLCSILEFEVPIIFTKDSADTASFLNVLANRVTKPNRQISLKAKKKAHSKAEQQQFIIEGFPGIGPATAKELLKRFKTIKAIINAPAEELGKINRLGKKKADLIREIIETEFS